MPSCPASVNTYLGRWEPALLEYPFRTEEQFSHRLSGVLTASCRRIDSSR